MPLLTTLIDDKSPLITYDDTWLDGTSADDTMASYYFLGTYMTNNVTNGQATFSFNGTALWIYSAERSNHGSFSVQVDDDTFSGLSSLGNNTFQQPIFNTSVSQGLHTVKLTNTATGNLYVGIDVVVWQSEVGNEGDLLLTEIVPDTDSRFQYQGSAWATTSSTSSIDLNLFNNGTGHLTQTSEANVIFTFTVNRSLHRLHFLMLSGEAVSLVGTSGPSNGLYSVQLDGGQSVIYNASNGFVTNYGAMLYYADNLGSGSHQIILTCLSAQEGQLLSLDHAQLWTIANNTSQNTPGNTTNGTTGGTTGSTTNNNATSNSQNELSSGAIAGITVAAVVGILGALAAILFYRRRWQAAVAKYHELHRIYTPQRLPAAGTVPSTGFSSSLEMRGNTNSLRNENPFEPSPDSGMAVELRDVRPETQLPENYGLTRRSFQDASDGPSPEARLPGVTGTSRRENVVSALSTDHTSVALTEAPPNYVQATGNGMPARG